jgi:hypothetical protein
MGRGLLSQPCDRYVQPDPPRRCEFLLDDMRGIVPLCQWNSFSSTKNESSRVRTVPTSNFGCAFDCSNQCIHEASPANAIEFISESVVVGPARLDQWRRFAIVHCIDISTLFPHSDYQSLSTY